MGDPQVQVYNALSKSMTAMREAEYALSSVLIHTTADPRIRELRDRQRQLADDIIKHINTRQTWQ